MAERRVTVKVLRRALAEDVITQPRMGVPTAFTGHAPLLQQKYLDQHITDSYQRRSGYQTRADRFLRVHP